MCRSLLFEPCHPERGLDFAPQAKSNRSRRACPERSRRDPCTPQPRPVASGRSPAAFSYAPLGLGQLAPFLPRLTPWAAIFRSFGASVTVASFTLSGGLRLASAGADFAGLA